MNIEKYTPTLHFLRQEGYSEVDEVHNSGEFSVRGDTITVWPAAYAQKFKLHYLGEDIERVEHFVNDVWSVSPIHPDLLSNGLQTEHGLVYPGEYIVHPFHGVGIFQGVIKESDYAGEEKIYLALEYAGNDRLLVPWDRKTELMPYIGTRHPRLTRLYSKAWQATKERVQKDLIKVARSLLKIYAARQLNVRPVYSVANDWQEELSQTAGFELTDDQSRVLKEIEHDLLVQDQPMDRLLCGDVGFGKTEVALRAAAHVIASGKQVAFIAPTTVLVEQHAAVVKKRFEGLPINVGHISRLTKNQDGVVMSGIRKGTLDLIVGTHKLLGKDIEWKDLGLLIIDEEQKFGVVHKERLKEMRPALDVLSLSATPIPRTLSMSLSGLRGLSILRHAPHGRLPVKTMVEPYKGSLIKEAIKTELTRSGQMYVVYNRVQPLAYLAEQMRKYASEAGFPDARIAIAHGQLSETDLASRMAAFMNGEVDILVASTIVEHGLDSAKANTLLVLRSERFGLSDLYQLRGRVGRRDIQAHAYFLTGSIDPSQDKDLPEEDLAPELLTQTARQRLQALLEADTLGSGWTLALRDLEIRGGGNILGKEQHGSMESIGLLLYAQLLQEEIGRQAQQQGIVLFQKIQA